MRGLPWLMGGLVVAVGLLLVVQSLLQRPGSAVIGSPTGPAPADGAVVQGHVYTGITDEPESLNPFTVGGGTARRYVLGFTHDVLIDTDPATGELRGAVAETWQEEPDGGAFTVRLRPGIHFADGSELTADDVLFTWEAAHAASSLLGSMGDGMNLVRTVQLLDGTPARLRIELQRPHFAGVRAVGESWIVVQKQFFMTRLRELAAAAGLDEAPQPGSAEFPRLLASIKDSGPGSGPYMIGQDEQGRSTWRQGQDLRLVRNPLCWRRSAASGSWNFEGIRLLFQGDPSVAYTELTKKNLDWYGAAGIDRILEREPKLRADYRKVVYDYPNLGIYMVQWNHRNQALADVRVRQALAMLFDRQAITDKLLEGNARPAVAYGKLGQPGYPRDLQPPKFDPVAARRLLREAGYDHEAGTPLKLRLFTGAGNEVFRRILDLASDAAAHAGVELEVRTAEWGGLADLTKTSDAWDGVLLYFGFRSYVDPYDMFHSAGGSNVMGFRDDEVDRLLEQARTERDGAQRAALFEQAHRRIDELQPVAFLAHVLVAVLFNAHIENAEPGPLGLWPERFWVPLQYQRH